MLSCEGCRIGPQTRSKRIKIPETSGINVLYPHVGVCRSFRNLFHGASCLRSYSTSFMCSCGRSRVLAVRCGAAGAYPRSAGRALVVRAGRNPTWHCGARRALVVRSRQCGAMCGIVRPRGVRRAVEPYTRGAIVMRGARALLVQCVPSWCEARPRGSSSRCALVLRGVPC